MRASSDQVRTATIDLVDATRGHAVEVVTSGADLLAASIEKGAAILEDGIERVVESGPAISIEVAARRRRSGWRTATVALVVLVVGLVVLRKVRRRGPAPVVAPVDAPVDDTPLTESGLVRFDVVPAEAGGWDVTRAPGGFVVGHQETQAQGIDHATELAAVAGGGEVVIHARDGHPRDTRKVAPAR